MGKSIQTTVQLDDNFSANSDTRQGHISQTRREMGDAIRDLQEFANLPKEKATAMLYPKGGSRCRGLSARDLAL